MEQILTLDVPGGGQTPVFGTRAVAGAPVVVVFPAMGVPAGYYRRLVEALARTGLNAVVVETPAQGASTPPEGGFQLGYGELARDFFPAAVARVRGEFPGSPAVALGHSMGGHLALLHLGLTAGEDGAHAIEGLVLVASGTNHWRAFGPRSLLVLAQTQLVQVVTWARGHWPGERFGFGGRQHRRVINDWAGIARHGRWHVRGLGNLDAALQDVALPILGIDVANDTFTPASALDAMLAKVPRARVTRWHYPGPEPAEGVDPVRVEHLTWAKHPGHLPDRVRAWIESDVLGGAP